MSLTNMSCCEISPISANHSCLYCLLHPIAPCGQKRTMQFFYLALSFIQTCTVWIISSYCVTSACPCNTPKTPRTGHFFYFINHLLKYKSSECTWCKIMKHSTESYWVWLPIITDTVPSTKHQSPVAQTFTSMLLLTSEAKVRLFWGFLFFLKRLTRLQHPQQNGESKRKVQQQLQIISQSTERGSGVAGTVAEGYEGLQRVYT